jgi:hypothetical protein
MLSQYGQPDPYEPMLKFVHVLGRRGEFGETFLPALTDPARKPQSGPCLDKDRTVDIAGNIFGVSRFSEHDLVDHPAVHVAAGVIAALWPPIDRDRQLDHPGRRSRQLSQSRRGLRIWPVLCVSALLGHGSSLTVSHLGCVQAQWPLMVRPRGRESTGFAATPALRFKPDFIWDKWT